ncbi:VRR-NUC domain-containing protein [Azonexus hydrophilus]|uniref:VRR-NUC domain-containing protein n=1 Tax=Azonexus hydrophilus TaxID=418702 RepID=A0ABZ2XNV5_9RHOO
MIRISAANAAGIGPVQTGARISIAEFRAINAGTALPSAITENAAPQRKAKTTRRQSPEEDLHRECVAWAELHQHVYPVLRWLVHVPNGGKRSAGEGGKLKAMGAKKGFPDLFIPHKSGRWAGFVMELKSPTGQPTTEQRDWLNMFDDQGYLVSVGRSLEFFVAKINEYLKG